MNHKDRSSKSRDGCEEVILDDAQDFVALREEWEELYRNAPAATPFQSWPWLYSWWEFYGEGYELRLVTIRDNGILVGVMPLMLERRAGFGRLLLIGTGLTDYQDVLAREGWERHVSEAAVRSIRQIDGWQVADLQQLHPEAVTWSIFERWAGPRTRLWQDNLPVIEVRPWNELLVSLSKNLRSTTRRTVRRADTDGVRCKQASANGVGRAARDWMALHQEAWQGRDIVPMNLTRKFRSYQETVARRMTAHGLGSISEFWRDEEVIISHFLIFGRDFVAEHLVGARQDALQRYQVSSLCMWDAINVAQSRGSACLNLLRGEESYKLRWCSEITTNHQAILGRRLIVWAPYSVYHAVLSRAKRYAYSADAPRWTKVVWSKYRILRDMVNKYRMFSA